MIKLIAELKALEFQFVSLKQKLKNEGVPCKKSKEYKRLQKAISRCKEKIEAEKTSSSKSLPIIKNNSSPINVVEFFKENKNSPAVRKVLTLAEKELLIFARRDLAWGRDYANMQQPTVSECLAIDKAFDQPPTAYEEDLLAFWKLYPVVSAGPSLRRRRAPTGILFRCKRIRVKNT